MQWGTGAKWDGRCQDPPPRLVRHDLRPFPIVHARRWRVPERLPSPLDASRSMSASQSAALPQSSISVAVATAAIRARPISAETPLRSSFDSPNPAGAGMGSSWLRDLATGGQIQSRTGAKRAFSSCGEFRTALACLARQAVGCQPASAHSSPLTAELEIMKQIASAISSGRIKRRSCV